MDLDSPILEHIGTGQQIKVIKNPFTVGRGLYTDFVIEHRVVSRSHFTLEKFEQGWRLFDLSTNGTLVNDEIYKSVYTAKLQQNDEICLGLPELTYKFLLPDESARNCQIGRIRMEENYNSPANESVNSPRPRSCSSFEENGISDDVLNNLADDLLRESQKDKENKSEDENQPSTSSKVENVPEKSGGQVNLPSSSNQVVVHNLNDNDQNNELDVSTSSAETVIDLEDDYECYIVDEAQQPVSNSAEALPNLIDDKDIQPSSSISTNNNTNECEQPLPHPISIDITDDEPNEVTPSSVSTTSTSVPTSSTSNESELVHPITIDITDDNNAHSPDSLHSSTTSSTSTITYSLPEELQNSENVTPANSLASSNNHEPRPAISTGWTIINAGNSCTAAGLNTNNRKQSTLVIKLVKTPCDPSGFRVVCTTNSILQVPSTSVTSQANNNKRIRIQAASSVMPPCSNWIQQYISNQVYPNRNMYVSYSSAANSETPQNLNHTSTSTGPPINMTYGALMSTVATGNNVPVVSSTTIDDIGNGQADSSVNRALTIGDQRIPILDSRTLPVVAHRGEVQDTAAITTIKLQNTETKAKSPPKIVQDFQKPGTSKDSEKYEPKQLNQGLDQNKYEEMENELMCIICSNLFIKAVTLGCSHSFCQYCIESWKKNKTDCPICRTKMVSSIRTLVLDNIIEKMMESSSEEEKNIRKEVIEERQKIIADAEAAAKNQQQHNNQNRHGRGQGRNRRRNRQPPVPPVQQPIEVPDSPSSTDSSSNESVSDDSGSEGIPLDFASYYDDDWYDYEDDPEYNGIDGVYYGGYGRCYNCGVRGHWANGCPYR